MATYVLTIFLFTLIVLLWVLLLNIQKADETKTTSEGILSPFDGIKEIFTNMFEQINTTNIPAIPQGLNESLPAPGTARQADETMNPLDINTETSNQGVKIGTTTMESASGTPL